MLSRSFWPCDRTAASHAACSLLGTYRSLEPEPELWLGWAALPFPMRGASPWRRRAKWDERRGRLQHNRKTQTTPITPAQTSPHPRFPRHIEPGADSSPFCTLLPGPVASAVAPPALIFPVRLPANASTRYVNTTRCLSCHLLLCTRAAHHKLTHRKTTTTAGPSPPVCVRRPP